jgi:hypothetical protein
VKLALRLVALVGLLLLLTGRSASAAPRVDPTCDPVDQAQITGELSDDGSEATFTVLNTLPLCAPVDIGQAVYLKDADGLVFPQTLSDSATGSITTGTLKLSVEIPVDGVFPDCFWQADAFTGPVIEDLSGGENVYGPRLLDGMYGETATCSEVSGETTTTTSTTTTTTTDTTIPDGGNPPTPPGDVDSAVLGAQIQRSAPLARTGPTVDIFLLVAAAGTLLIIGSAAITGARYRRR